MSFDLYAEANRRVIAVIFLVRALAGDGCRKPSHSPGRRLGPMGFHPRASTSRPARSACHRSPS
jgi:hypothetical protein